MKKRGQISVFLIIASVIIIIAGFYFYAGSTKGRSDAAAKVLRSSDADIVKSYAESCIKKISEDALFDRIGLQGGYTDASSDSVSYQGHQVPYFLKGTAANGVASYNSNIPALDFIKDNLAHHIENEFESCFNPNVFIQIGLKIVKTGSAKADVSLNEGDVSIKLDYPILIQKEKAETKAGSFSVSLPIRLKALHESAALLAEKAKNSQPSSYDIAGGCGDFDKNGLTNVYLKASDDGSLIVQFVDFSTYQNNYFKSYIFQFAARGVNINGHCAG